MAKIVNELVLNEVIKQLGQLIADNSYDFIPYTDDEISDLFSLTPEEVAHLTDLIADTIVSQYKLWSSKKVNDELTNAKSECNDYTDSMLSNISSITIDCVEQLPVTGNSSTIYILKATDGSAKDTLNLYKDGSWINIGDFEVDLTQYYNMTQMNQLLLKKANDNEVVKQDDVIVDTSLATTANVISATTTIEELNKKVDKTVILNTADEVNSFDRTYQSFVIDSTVAGAVGLPYPPNSTWFCIHLSHSKGFKYPSQIAFEYTGAKKIMYRVADNGVWSAWRTISNTQVANVPFTKLTLNNNVFTKIDINNAYISYSVYNGMCTITCKGIGLRSTGSHTVTSDIPKPVGGYAMTTLQVALASNVPSKPVLLTVDNNELKISSNASIGHFWGTLTYPVAES